MQTLFTPKGYLVSPVAMRSEAHAVLSTPFEGLISHVNFLHLSWGSKKSVSFGFSCGHKPLSQTRAQYYPDVCAYGSMVKGYKGFRSHNEWFEFAVPKYGYSLRIAVALEQCKLAIPYIKFRQKHFFFGIVLSQWTLEEPLNFDQSRSQSFSLESLTGRWIRLIWNSCIFCPKQIASEPMKIVLIPKPLFIVLDTVVSGSGLCQGQVCFQKKNAGFFTPLVYANCTILHRQILPDDSNLLRLPACHEVGNRCSQLDRTRQPTNESLCSTLLSVNSRITKT